MQSENRMFDDFVKMMNGVAGTLAGMAREAQAGACGKFRELDGGPTSSTATNSTRSRRWPSPRARRMRRLGPGSRRFEAERAGPAASAARQKRGEAPRRQLRRREPERGRTPGRARRQRPDRNARATYFERSVGLCERNGEARSCLGSRAAGRSMSCARSGAPRTRSCSSSPSRTSGCRGGQERRHL